MASVQISKRDMKRKQRTGAVVTLVRYVVSYRDPKTGKRVQKFFGKQKEAQAAQGKILADIREGIYSDRRETPTVEQAFDLWLEDRRGQIKPQTVAKYEYHRRYICGPLLSGTREQRFRHTVTGKLPPGCEMHSMLGKVKIVDLTTAQIRSWHKLLIDTVGARTANKARLCLQTILALAAEDYNVRPPVMPRRLGRGKPKVKKAILLPEQVQVLLKQAESDKDYGLYYAFPFLTGVRPSEQLGLLWEDIDFQKNVINIRRMQEKTGEITNFTKTIAGSRSIPMSVSLQAMLLDWKERCPRREGKPQRVFPNIGHVRFKLVPRTGGGNALLYSNFRTRVWNKALERAGLPHVTPHSARHSFISTLQSLGVEVAVAAKLAGHASVTVTLNHYTQAMRGSEEAIEALTKAFQMPVADNIAASAPP